MKIFFEHLILIKEKIVGIKTEQSESIFTNEERKRKKIEILLFIDFKTFFILTNKFYFHFFAAIQGVVKKLYPIQITVSQKLLKLKKF